MINRPRYSKDLRDLAEKNPGKTLATVAVEGLTYQGWITKEQRTRLVEFVKETIEKKPG